MLRRLCTCVVALALAPCITSPALAIEADARAAALLSITLEEIRADVAALADDTFEGREAGSRGNRAAGIYIVERLKRAGLAGGGDKGGYYQRFGNYANILVVVPGRDPQLANQWIVAGAHFDHVGYGTPRNSYGPTGHIHNGADDNASGVSGMLELAEAIAKLPEKPSRSILLAFWDGEEKGLLGSQHWVASPTVPLERVALAVNADMIGRMQRDRVEVFGTRTSPGLRRLISRQNDVSQLLLDFTWEMRADSDHHSFYSRGIPTVMLHTGLHNDYHRPSDDPEKINVQGLQKVSQLLFNFVVEAADAPRLAGFRQQSRGESKYDQQSRETVLPPPPGRLGVRWDQREAAADRIVMAAITPGSAADRGGLQLGDRIVRFAGKEVTDVEQFRRLVLGAANPVAVAVERRGSAEPVELSLALAGSPVRLGISWRLDDAEPGTLIVNRVTPGSPADQAGLKPHDRVYRIAGQDFVDSATFQELVSNHPGPIVLDVETHGRVRTVEVE